MRGRVVRETGVSEISESITYKHPALINEPP